MRCHTLILLPAEQPKVVDQQVADHQACQWQPQDESDGQGDQGPLVFYLALPEPGEPIEDGNAEAVCTVEKYAENQPNLRQAKKGGSVDGNGMLI